MKVKGDLLRWAPIESTGLTNRSGKITKVHYRNVVSCQTIKNKNILHMGYIDEIQSTGEVKTFLFIYSGIFEYHNKGVFLLKILKLQIQ